MSVTTHQHLPRLLTIQELCDQTGLGRANAYKKLIRLGRLPAVRIGRPYGFQHRRPSVD